jgi:hypothetical protein
MHPLYDDSPRWNSSGHNLEGMKLNTINRNERDLITRHSSTSCGFMKHTKYSRKLSFKINKIV